MKFFYYVLTISFFCKDAYAYLDPGTGGIIFQLLLAFLIGVGIFFNNLKIKTINIFNKVFGKKDFDSKVKKDK